MITEFFETINWAAVLVATLAWFGFSSVWYSVPPLSGAWARSAKVEVNPDSAPSLTRLLIPTVVGYFLSSIVIALIVGAVGATTVEEGLALGIALGIPFGLISSAVIQMYEAKGRSYWLINGINNLVAFTIVSVIIAVWP